VAKNTKKPAGKKNINWGDDEEDQDQPQIEIKDFKYSFYPKLS
jgi:hypothetical protein